MAIHTMCSESEADYAMPFYSGHERGLIRHSKTCPHFSASQVCVSDDSYRQEIRAAGLHSDCVLEGSYGDRCSGPFEAVYMQITHTGCVLETRERSGRDDSDFYARVWSEEKQRVVEVEYATTRGWTYPNSATVDATEDVIAKVEAYECAEQERARLLALECPSLQSLSYAALNGEQVELKEDCKTRAATSEPCRKCSGRGYWQNPNRPADRRPCFGCNGACVRKVPAAKGTPMVVHTSGTRGKVIRTFEDRSRYGTWVRSQRVELLKADGTLFAVDISKVRLIERSE